MDDVVIAIWLWQSDNGWRKGYSADHVNNMCKMLKKHISIPYKVVCVTDMPNGIKECETFPLWDKPFVKVGMGRPNCYKRLNLFRPDLEDVFGDRVISMDIDCVIRRNIDHIVSDTTPFKALRGTSAPYNGSLWQIVRSTHCHVWHDFDPSVSPKEVLDKSRRPGKNSPYYGSDQAWISYKLPGAATWGTENGIFQFHSDRSVGNIVQTNPAMVFFAGAVKPWTPSLSKSHPMLYKEYQKQIS